MTSTLRVLHVVPSLDPSKGGPSRTVLGLARAQAACGATVDLVAGGSAPAGAEPSAPLSIQYAPHLRLPFAIPGQRLLRLLWGGVQAADIVHLHSLWNGVITQTAWLCRLSGMPMVLSPHGMLDAHNMERRRRFKRLYLAAFERGNLAALAGFHFLDETERAGCEWLEPAGCAPIVILPNGLDLDGLRRRLAGLAEGLPAAAAGDASARHLVFLGRLNVIKGLELQLEAVADLRAAGFNAHLHWIGPDDGEWPKLRALACRLGVAEAVHWHGPVYGDERLGWLRDADAVLLTSHYECNSNMAAETLAVGGLLLATDTCHLDRAAAAGAARVVTRDRAQLSAALLDLLTCGGAATAVREQAQVFARAELDWLPLAERMIDFYRRVLDSGASCAP